MQWCLPTIAEVIPVSSPTVPDDRRVVVISGGQPWAVETATAIALTAERVLVLDEYSFAPRMIRNADIAVIAIGDEDALSTLRQLRQLGTARPGLLAMVQRDDPVLERAMDAGADDCLIVPVGALELPMRLSSVATRRRLAAEQAMLRRVAVTVAAGFDHPTLYDQVARELAKLLRADGGRVVEFTSDGEAVLLGTWRRSDFEPIAPGTTLRLAPTWALAEVQRTGRPARSELSPADAAAARAPLRASLAAPVNVGGSPWGAVAVSYAQPRRAHEGALIQLERVADLVSLAVANAEVARRLSLMATTDSLTGLVNHRAFHERLAQEVARTARSSEPTSMAVIDLDHFKLVNDTHGHRVGDEALRAVSRVLAEHARAGDVIGRVGGEEFAWMMPGASLEDVLAAAERARSAIAAEPVSVAGFVTASIGVAHLEPGMSAQALFDAADAALYEAKRAGRDCVRAWAGRSRSGAGAYAGNPRSI